MKTSIEPAIDFIVQAFRPDPIKCEINGKIYWIERVTEGWMWRNEHGDGQEDFGIECFPTAADCQADAMRYAGEVGV